MRMRVEHRASVTVRLSGTTLTRTPEPAHHARNKWGVDHRTDAVLPIVSLTVGIAQD